MRENIEGKTLLRRLLDDDFADAISSLCGFAHCVKGQFWSTLLFMFYLETILAFISDTSTFVANELLRWPLVLSNVALSLLLSVIN